MRSRASLLAELGLSLAAGGLVAALFGPQAGGSLLWGGLAAVANSAIVHLQAKSRMKSSDPRLELRNMYRSSMERFFVVMIALAAGMKLLGFTPAAVVAGFALGQVIHVGAQALNRIEI